MPGRGSGPFVFPRRCTTPDAAETRLKAAVRRGLRKQLDAFLLSRDPESGMLMLDVLAAHAVAGFGLAVGVETTHPDQLQKAG